MTWEGWVTIGTIVLMVFALLRNLAGPDTVLLAGLTLLMTLGLFSNDPITGLSKLPTAADSVAGFGNSGLITIGVLFVIAAGLSRTGAMDLLAQPLLGQPKTVLGAQARMMPPIAALSAFINNTPVVAMFMPIVNDWCKKTGLAPSKLFMPLSYAAILGGACTLIGTSTNVVVYNLILDGHASGDPTLEGVKLNMFTISKVAVPAAIVGMIYIFVASRKLLPDRSDRTASMIDEDPREYTVEMLVQPGTAIDGQTIEQAGLRQLPGTYLAEIEREGDLLVAVAPERVLRGGDRLIFFGLVKSVVDLQKIRGLVPATNQVFKLSDPRPNRHLVEAVVSDNCPLVGMSIRDGEFRTVYDAVVIAVHRGDQRLKQKIGDIVLKAGDTLLIDTHPRFLERHRNRSDFYLVSAVADSRPKRHDKAWIALAILVVMVTLVTAIESLTLLNAALIAGGLMVLTRCLTPHEARQSPDWRALLAIGSAIGIGRALGKSGAADTLADMLITTAEPFGPYGMLTGIYLATMLFNMAIGSVGSAVLIFPIALQAVAKTDNLSFMPFAISIMMASSCSYATPISYPTNLMVYGPGGYRFSDYIRFGLPLNLIIMAVTIILAPAIWDFSVIR